MPKLSNFAIYHVGTVIHACSTHVRFVHTERGMPYILHRMTFKSIFKSISSSFFKHCNAIEGAKVWFVDKCRKTKNHGSLF